MQQFEVRRVDGVYPVDEILRKFNLYGIVLLKNYLAPNTQDGIRGALTARLQASLARGDVLKDPDYPNADFMLGDVLSVRALSSFNYIFFSKEFITIAKDVLGSHELLYYGDSSTQFDQAARGFHKDNTERSNALSEDWLGDYGLIRAAFYCEDHSKHSGGLKVRISSHNLESSRDAFDKNKISCHAGKSVDVISEYGDLAFWSLRLTHSGNYRKLKGFPNLSLHPRIEQILPKFFTVEEEMRRYFMSCTFARPGVNLKDYIEKIIRREKDYRPYLERARNVAETQEILDPLKVGLYHEWCNYYGVFDKA